MTAHFQDGGEHFYSRVKIKCQNLFTFIKCLFSIRRSDQYLIGGEETKNDFHANLRERKEGRKEGRRKRTQRKPLRVFSVIIIANIYQVGASCPGRVLDLSRISTQQSKHWVILVRSVVSGFFALDRLRLLECNCQSSW